MPVDTASIPQPTDQGVTSAFASYDLRSRSRKAAAATDSGSSAGSGQSQLKPRKGFHVLEAMKNMRDSWEEVRMSTRTGVWKTLIPAQVDDLEGPRLQCRKSPRMNWNRRWGEGVTALLWPHDGA